MKAARAQIGRLCAGGHLPRSESAAIASSPDDLRLVEADSRSSNSTAKADLVRLPGGLTPRATRRCCFAYERLLEARQDLHGKVELFLAAVGGCRGMRIYDDIQRAVEESSAASTRFARIDWNGRCRLSTRRIPLEGWWPGSARAEHVC